MKKTIALISTLFTLNVFALDVDCDRPYDLYQSSLNSISLNFHNGGGSWTGFSRTYLKFIFEENMFSKFVYDSGEVDLSKVSEFEYYAVIRVKKGFNTSIETVNCSIDLR